jgi:hypothetical protein
MSVKFTVSVLANFVLIGILVVYGFRLFAEYHAHGKWANNATALLSGLGILALALALILTPQNASVIAIVAQTNASKVFFWTSSGLLLSAIAAFGILAYSRPSRLQKQRRKRRVRPDDEITSVPRAS